MIDYVDLAKRALERWQAQSEPAPHAEVPTLERWPESLRELAEERAAASGDPELARAEVWAGWCEWKSSALNRLFLEQGQTRQAGRIAATTVKYSEMDRTDDGRRTN
jgi:hypothetical protein